MFMRVFLITVGVGFFLVGTASANLFDMGPGLTSLQFVPVGNPGNTADDNGSGSVGYTYKMGKNEVSAGQYCEFLNAVAKTDTYYLYHQNMGSPSVRGCNIIRSGSPGSYTYSVPEDWANRPVNYVPWGSALRFCNWLTNGQPTGTLTGNGAQDAWLTEDGSYTLNGGTSDWPLYAARRKADARYVIPTDSEWYKAAYYDPAKPGGPGYWDYPTRSDVLPSNDLDSSGTNNANYFDGTYDDAGNPDPAGFTIGDPYWRTEAGAFASSPSAYGTFDQSGNVMEWDEFGIMLQDQKPPHWSWLYQYARGGCFAGGPGWAPTFSALPAGQGQAYEFVGFRVAYVPEPAMLGLMGLCGLEIIRRRRPPRHRATAQPSQAVATRLAGVPLPLSVTA